MAGNETTTPHKPLLNEAAPGVSYYVPRTDPTPGTLLPVKDWPQNEKAPLLFQPLKIRGVELKNRIGVSPMCEYSCPSGTGVHTDWHLIHLGSFARGGAGLVFVEASAVTENGMISAEDSGIWGKEHIPPLKRTVEFLHSQGAKAAMQLAHAGRKASTYAPWLTDGIVHPNDTPNITSMVAQDDEHGWQSKVVGPSAIAFDDKHATPHALEVGEIKELVGAFVAAAERAVEAGFDVIELHGAHGYLFHNFFSPVSNQRTDEYGGSLENRIRIALEVAKAVRAKIPADMPLFFRVSATDWHDRGEKDSQGNWISWGPEQTIELVKQLQPLGVDLIDTSSGGNYSAQKISLGPSYQVPFAKEIKAAVPTMLVGAVGLLTEAKQIEDHLQNGDADVAFLARQFLRDPNFPITAAYELGVVVSVPVQYQRAHTRMFKR